MDPGLYPRMAEVEDTHWWFASRRAIVDRILGRLGLPEDAAILEPGCGTGGNFAMLARHGRVYAMDSNEAALAFARARGSAQVEPGRLPDRIPFGDLRFDLIVMTDVLEHLDQDGATLRALRPRLKPGGWLLLTVPAMQWLWSAHDATHHHLRRYDARALRALVSDAGYDVRYLSYYNIILFPAIAGIRMLQRAIGLGDGPGSGHHDLSMPSPLMNAVLLKIFSSERYVVGAWPLPFGVSLIAVARA